MGGSDHYLVTIPLEKYNYTVVMKGARNIDPQGVEEIDLRRRKARGYDGSFVRLERRIPYEIRNLFANLGKR